MSQTLTISFVVGALVAVPAFAAPPEAHPLPEGARARLGSPRFRHDGPVSLLRFLPDGKTLLSRSQYGPLRTWDTSGRAVRSTHVITPTAYGPSLVVSDDGSKMALVGGDRQIALFEAGQNGVGRRFPEQPLLTSLLSAAFSPDSRTLATWGADRALRLWDVTTGQELRRLGKPPTPNQHYVVSGTPAPLVFSPDSKLLAVADDWSVRLWDVEQGKELRWLGGHTGGITAMHFTPDSKRLVTAAYDRAVRVWDVATGKTVVRLPVGVGGARALALSADGKTVATGGQDRTIHLWNVADGKPLRSIEGPASFVSALAFSPDGRTLYVGSYDQVVRTYDVATGVERDPVTGHVNGVTCLAFRPDGKVLASGGGDRAIILWDTATAQPVRTLTGHEMGLTHLQFSPEGHTLLSASLDRTLRRWNAADGRELSQFVCSPNAIHSLAFSGDGRRVALAAADRTVRLWDVAAETEKWNAELPLRQQQYGFSATTTLSPDGRTLLTLASDQHLRQWNAEQGEEVTELSLPGVLAHCPMAMSADGRSLALGTGPAPRLLEVASGKERLRFEGAAASDVPPLPPGAVRPRPTPVLSVAGPLALSPDGRLLATTSGDGSLRFWNLTTGKVVAQRQGPAGPARAVAFHPGGRLLAVACADSTILLWDVPTSDGMVRRSAEPTEAQAAALWEELASDDAARAFRAVQALAASPVRAVSLLRDRLRPDAAFDHSKVPQLLKDLDADTLETREQATRALIRAGKLVEPAVRKALNGGPEPEVRARLELVLRELSTGRPQSGESLRALRALEVLEAARTVEARALVERLANGPAGARLTQEAKATRDRLAQR